MRPKFTNKKRNSNNSYTFQYFFMKIGMQGYFSLNISDLKKNWGGGTLTWPPPTVAYMGVSPFHFFCGHVIYQMKANEKSSSKIEVGALCPPTGAYMGVLRAYIGVSQPKNIFHFFVVRWYIKWKVMKNHIQKLRWGHSVPPTGAYMGVSRGVYRGFSTPKYSFIFCGHVIHQMKGNEKSY